MAVKGNLCCGIQGCGSAYSLTDLARVLPQDLLAELLQVQAEVKIQEVRNANEEEIRQRVALEMERLQQGNRRDVEQAVHHIHEHCLTLKCPRCGQAFIDFDACM